jgi:hypothetical protein
LKLAEVRKFALALPGAVEAPHFDYASFRVGGRIFCTVPPGEGFIHVFLPEEERERALALAPDTVEKLYWGAKVTGLRLTLAKAKAPFVKELLQAAWALKARPVKLKARRRL